MINIERLILHLPAFINVLLKSVYLFSFDNVKFFAKSILNICSTRIIY